MTEFIGIMKTEPPWLTGIVTPAGAHVAPKSAG